MNLLNGSLNPLFSLAYSLFGIELFTIYCGLNGSNALLCLHRSPGTNFGVDDTKRPETKTTKGYTIFKSDRNPFCTN